MERLGVRHGFAGLLGGEFTPLGPRDVGGIIQQGGTILGSARCDDFKTPVGCEQALGVLVGQLKGAVAATPLDEVAGQKKPLDPSLFALARTMSS